MRRLCCALIVLATLACNDDTTAPDPNADSPDLSTLGIGRVRTLKFTEAQEGITIPAELSAAEYLVVVSNINVRLQDPSDYEVRGDRGAVFESKLRTYERRTLASPQLHTTSIPWRQQRIPGPPRLATIPQVGDPMTIKVLSEVAGQNICESYVTTTGTVRAVSQRAVIISDNDSPTGGFTAQDYQNIAKEFDEITYPTGVGYFGNPTDIDGNSRIIIYYTPRVNEMTPPGQANQTGYVGGFFFAGDLFSVAGCSASNEAEIFYLLAPDPNAVFGNQFLLNSVRQVTRGTVAHEFQHMINSGRRIAFSAPFESAWLDEALSHFAEDATGRVAVGIGDLGFINRNRMEQIGVPEQNAFFIQNFVRTRYFLERPDTTGPIRDNERATSLAARGASWALVRYAADWFSGNSPRTFMRAMAAGPDTGVANLVRNAKVPLDTILSRWLVTLYTDHSNIAGLPSLYNYRSYDFRGVIGTTTGYPLRVTTIGSGNVAPAIVPSSSAAYFLVSSNNNGDARTIQVRTDTGDPATDPDGRIYIVRLR